VATFKYTILGKASTGGTVEAPDRATALRQLMAGGVVPASLEAARGREARAAARAPDASAAGDRNGAASGNGQSKDGTGAASSNGTSGGNGASGSVTNGAKAPPARGAGLAALSKTVRRGRSSMSLSDTASFLRELATAVQAGLPLVPALRTLARSGRTEAQQKMLAHLIERVEQGQPLAEACRTWGKPFGELLVNLLKAGEASGRLGDVLHQASDLLEREVALRRSLSGALIYPAMLAVLGAAALVIVTVFIVPAIIKPMEAANVQLPTITRIVVGITNAILSFWWAILAVAAVAVVAWSRAWANPASRLVIDRSALRLPMIGSLLRDAAVARFTRTLGTLVRAGLPVLTALRLTAATLTNAAMRSAMESVCDQVAAGRTIAEPLEKCGLFPPLLVQIVSLGERSGKLPELLQQAASSLDARTESRVKVFTQILPPLLVVVLAVLIGFVIAAILLALLQMQDAVGTL
jgi:general secretion pathway protein F